MRKILLPVSDSLKAKLDQKRREGYPINGFIRHVLQRETGQHSRARLSNQSSR
jgi:hypothetical protein